MRVTELPKIFFLNCLGFGHRFEPNVRVLCMQISAEVFHMFFCNYVPLRHKTGRCFPINRGDRERNISADKGFFYRLGFFGSRLLSSKKSYLQFRQLHFLRYGDIFSMVQEIRFLTIFFSIQSQMTITYE